jgi:glycosyltransferase involved in cell wall biosynthesis
VCEARCGKNNLRVGVLLIEPCSVLPSVCSVVDHTVRAVQSQFQVRIGVFRYSDPPSRHRDVLADLCANSDVIVGQNRALLQFRAEEGFRVPIVFHAYGQVPYGAGRLLTRIHQFLGDSVMVSCRADLSLFQQFYDGDRLYPFLVPFCVDTDLFRALSQERRSAIRRGLGIPDGTAFCLYAGRLMPQKNVHLLLNILHSMLKRIPISLVIAGDYDDDPVAHLGVSGQDYAAYLNELVSRLGLEQNVRFLGGQRQEALADLYAASDVFINLTVHPDENFGLACVEAMASATPVIGTQWGGLADTVRAGLTGYPVPVIPSARGVKVAWREAAAYALDLISNPAVRSATGTSARRVALEEYSTSVFYRRVCEVVEETYVRFQRSARLDPLPPGSLPGVSSTAMELILLDLASRNRPVNTARSPVFGCSADQESLYEQVMRCYGGGGAAFPRLDAEGVPYFLTDVRLDELPQAVEVRDPGCPQVIELTPLEWEVLSRVDGSASVGQIEATLLRVDASELDAVWARLLREGLIWIETGASHSAGAA